MTHITSISPTRPRRRSGGRFTHRPVVRPTALPRTPAQARREVSIPDVGSPAPLPVPVAQAIAGVSVGAPRIPRQGPRLVDAPVGSMNPLESFVLMIGAGIVEPVLRTMDAIVGDLRWPDQAIEGS